MDREIWFYRFFGSYTPCHWKGVALLVGFLALFFVGAFGGQAALDALGYQSVDWIPFPAFFLATFIPLMVIAHRHS